MELLVTRQAPKGRLLLVWVTPPPSFLLTPYTPTPHQGLPPSWHPLSTPPAATAVLTLDWAIYTQDFHNSAFTCIHDLVNDSWQHTQDQAELSWGLTVRPRRGLTLPFLNSPTA